MNMLRTPILILFILLSYGLKAQWVTMPQPSPNALHTVYFLDENVGFIGGAEGSGILRTIDGGNSFTLYDHQGPDSLIVNGSNIYAYDFIDNLNGYAVGWNIWQNAGIILRTFDGGITWTVIKYGPVGGFVGEHYYTDVCYVNPSLIFVTGTDGRLERSLGGGFVGISTPTSNTLYSIDFGDNNNGVIAGEDITLYTSNGGTVWLPVTQTWNYYSVAYAATAKAIAVGGLGSIIETVNNGASWSTENSYVNDVFYSIDAQNSDTAYVSGDSYVWVTYDDGNLWERQLSSAFNGTWWEVFFVNDSVGWAVGHDGLATNPTLIKTTNGGGPTIPTAAFEIDPPGILCDDSLITFLNQGPPSYTYEWFEGANFIGNSYDDSLVLSGDSLYTITLVATNAFGSDTSSVTIFVEPSLAVQPFNLSLLPDSICAGMSSIVVVNTSELGVGYQLTDGINPIGSPVTGTGSAIQLPTGTVFTTTNFVVEATKTSACGSRMDTDAILLTVHPVPDSMLVAFALADTVCFGDSTLIEIQNSETNATYQLQDGGVPVGSPVTGTGGTIYVSTGSITTSTTFECYVFNSFGCDSQLDSTFTITVADPQAGFALSDTIIYTNGALNLSNTSTPGSYFWNFGAGAVPATSTATNPTGVTYPTAGDRYVVLTVTDGFGCQHTDSLHLVVVDSVIQGIGSGCDVAYWDTTALDTYYGRVLDMAVDAQGNRIVVGYRNTGSTSGIWTTSYNMFIAKIDATGTTVWEKLWNQEYNSYGSFATGVVTDDDGNVYVCGNISSDDFVIDTLVMDFSNNWSKGFVMRLDSMGQMEWVVYGEPQNSATFSCSDIELDHTGKLIVAVSQGTNANYNFPNGNVQINLTWGSTSSVTILKMDTNGDYINHRNFGMFAAPTFNPDPSSAILPRLCSLLPDVSIDCVNEISLYTSLRYNGQITEDGYAVSAQGNYTHVVAKLTSNFDFLDLFETFHGDYSPWYESETRFAVDEDQAVYTADSWRSFNTFEIAVVDNDTVDLVYGSILSKTVPGGTVEWRNLLRYAIILDVIEQEGGGVHVLGYYENAAVFESQNIPVQGLTGTTPYGAFLASYDSNGDLVWVRDIDWHTNSQPFSYLRRSGLLEKDDCNNIQFALKGDTLGLDGNNLALSGDHAMIGRYALDGNCGALSCGFSPCAGLDTLIALNPLDSSGYCAGETITLDWYHSANDSVDIQMVQTFSGQTTTIFSDLTGSTQQWVVPDSLSGEELLFVFAHNGSPDTLGPVFIYPAVNLTLSFYDTIICASTPIQLEAFGGDTYEWSPFSYLNNSQISNPVATTPTDIAYEVIATSNNGCKDTAQLNIEVRFPITNSNLYFSTNVIGDSVVVDGTLINTNGYDTSSMYYDFGDGNTINQVLDTSHVYSSPGTYTICLHATNACGSHSNCETITITGISDIGYYGVEVYPNPFRESFTVRNPGVVIRSYEVVDVQGRSILNNAAPLNASFDIQMPAGLSPGTYVLMLEMDNGMRARTLLLKQ